MSHFNLKSFIFYGGMIGSVLVLFNGVTAYGERNLKAPIKISGDYLLNSSDLPTCLQSEKIILTIAQSGIYVAGKLTLSPKEAKPAAQPLATAKAASQTHKSASANKTTPKPIQLHGLMQSQPFSLVGNSTQLGSCPQVDSPTDNTLTLQLQSQKKSQEKSLVGQLRWATLTLNITGQLQEPLLPEH